METMPLTTLFLIIDDPEFFEIRSHLFYDQVMSFRPNAFACDECHILAIPWSPAFMRRCAQHALASAPKGCVSELLSCYEGAPTFIARGAIKRKKRHRRRRRAPSVLEKALYILLAFDCALHRPLI